MFSEPAVILPPSVATTSCCKTSSTSSSVERPFPNWVYINSTKTWLTKLLLPEPETPVTLVNTPKGIDTSRFIKLFLVTPLNFSHPEGFRGLDFSKGRSLKRCSLVLELEMFFKPAGGPLYKISPPPSPASGPTSTIQSAWRITSNSCSTTKSELPQAFSLSKVFSKASVSAGCKPADGSSNTYTTPNKLLRTWVASLKR